MLRPCCRGELLVQLSDLPVIWLIAGAALMALELVVPGGIVFFLGMGAMFTALLLFAGFIEGWIQALTAWFVASLVFVFGLRGFAQRIIPAHVERGNTDEDQAAYDQTAVVVERIPATGEGRITFKGTTWLAKNHRADVDLEPGTLVRLVFRDNILWLVEAREGEKDKNP
jgi:inner membrane protein